MIFEDSSWGTVLESDPDWLDDLVLCLAKDWRRLASELGLEEEGYHDVDDFSHFAIFEQELEYMTKDEIINRLLTGN